MSNTQIIVVGIVGVSLIILLGALVMIVMVRLRRVIKLQFETIEKLLGSTRVSQVNDKPIEPSREHRTSHGENTGTGEART